MVVAGSYGLIGDDPSSLIPATRERVSDTFFWCDIFRRTSIFSDMRLGGRRPEKDVSAAARLTFVEAQFRSEVQAGRISGVQLNLRALNSGDGPSSMFFRQRSILFGSGSSGRVVLQEKANKIWDSRYAESVGLIVDGVENEDDTVDNYKQNKASSMCLKNLQQELKKLLSHPLQPKSYSRRYLTGYGITPLVQQQYEELSKQKLCD